MLTMLLKRSEKNAGDCQDGVQSKPECDSGFVDLCDQNWVGVADTGGFHRRTSPLICQLVPTGLVCRCNHATSVTIKILPGRGLGYIGDFGVKQDFWNHANRIGYEWIGNRYPCRLIIRCLYSAIGNSATVVAGHGGGSVTDPPEMKAS